MASSADAIIQTLLQGTGYGHTPGDFQQQADQHALSQQSVQHNNFALQADQQAQQEEAQYSRDVSAWMAAGSPPAALPALAVKYPKQYEAIKAGWDLKDKAQQTADLNFFGQAYAAAKNNRPELAKAQLIARRDAEKEAGIDTGELDDLIGQFDTDPKAATDALKSVSLAHIYAGDKDGFAKAFGLGDSKLINVSEGGGLYDPETKTWVQKPGNKVEYKTLKDANGAEHLFAVGGDGGLTPADGGTPTSASGIPRSVRNNNPGNIEDGSFAKSQPGYVSSDGRFAKFETPEAGAAAQTALLSQYGEQGRNTVAKIVSKWAPASDGNNVGAYAKFVAQKLGVHPNQALDMSDQKTLSGLQMAMASFEGGSQSKSNAPVAAPKGPGIRQLDSTPFADKPDDSTLMSPEELQFYAEKVANGENLPPLGMGKDAARLRKQILAKAADIAIDNHITGAQSNLIHADLKANTRSLSELTRLRTFVDSAERTASLNAEQVLKLAPAGVGGTVPVFNRWIQAGRKGVAGDSAVAKLDVGITTFANEYAKVMTTQTGTGGVTSDSARAEARGLINNAMTLKQLQGVIHQMRIDMNNRHTALITQDQILRGNIGAGAMNGASARPNPPPQAIAQLKASPGTAAQFDAIFGSGAAQRALGR